METLAKLMAKVLDDACPHYTRDDGWNVYGLDVCCVEYEIIAKKVDGEWRVWSYSTK